MTVATTEGGAVVPSYGGAAGDTAGLEDVGVSDLVLPRIRINHKEGTFEDSLSNAQFPKLQTVMLGLVKQRIMWSDDVQDGERPLCKSPDFEHGFPQMSTDVPKDKRFPWDKSNFSADGFDPAEGLNGHVTLPCSQCVFSQWDKGDWKQPPCSEQHTYIILYNPASEDGESLDVAEFVPALITFQRTGIKPSKRYLSSFAQSRNPLFTVYSQLGLTRQSRGSVDYAVPTFTRGPATEQEMWNEFATQARGIRDIVRQPPRADEDEVEGEGTASTAEAPAVAAAAPKATRAEPAKAEPAAPAPAAAAADDDDLPF